jgi:hypothetical protein
MIIMGITQKDSIFEFHCINEIIKNFYDRIRRN